METKSGPDRIAFANTLRGIACLLVVCSHYCGTFWYFPEVTTVFTNLPAPNPVPEVPALFKWVDPIKYLNPGPLGVAVFFLISGFVIPISLAKQHPLAFAVSRFFRIVPTYAVGLLFTVAVISGLAAWAGVAPPFQFKDVVLHLVPGVRDLANAKNIDGIIWTLEIEVKFYAICALFTLISRRNLASILWVPYVLGTVGVMTSIFYSKIPQSFVFYNNLFLLNAPYLVFMFIGVSLYLSFTKQIRTEVTLLSCASLFGLTILISFLGPYSASTPFLMNYGIAVIAFLAAMVYPNWIKQTKLTDLISKTSYPMYVVHGVAGYAIMRTMQPSSLSPYLIIVITSAITFTAAYMIHLFVETPTQRFGKSLSQRLFQFSDTPKVVAFVDDRVIELDGNRRAA